MKKGTIILWAAILASILACAGLAEGTEEAKKDYSAEEIWCQNGADSICKRFGHPFEEALTHVLSYLDSQSENQPKEVQAQMKMKIGDKPVEVAWESNESVEALKALAQNSLTIRMSMYGGFEQVGSIGQRLPSQDVQTNTSSGDIMLYSSSQLVVFYGNNSWAYTRLGRITDRSAEEMRALLSNGDVTITITVEGGGMEGLNSKHQLKKRGGRNLDLQRLSGLEAFRAGLWRDASAGDRWGRQPDRRSGRAAHGGHSHAKRRQLLGHRLGLSRRELRNRDGQSAGPLSTRQLLCCHKIPRL